MKVNVVDVGDVYKVIDAALFTAGKSKIKREPSEWLLAMCVAEHSPIRELQITIECHDIPYFAIMHLVRHKIGFEPFVKTSREDITNVPRDQRKQTDLGSFRATMNLHSLINISKERLCYKADKTTRELWQLIVDTIATHLPIVKLFCVPKCIYRTFCPEHLLGRSCGYADTEEYIESLMQYQTYMTIGECNDEPI